MDSYEECIKNEINQIANKDIFFDMKEGTHEENI